MFISEAIDQIVLFLREMCAKLRPELGAYSHEALESLLERLKIEVGWCLDQCVLCILNQLLCFRDSSIDFFASCWLLLFASLVGLCLLIPVQMMASTVDVIGGEAKDLQRVHQELKLGLNVADKGWVCVLRVKEVVAGRVGDFELVKPFVEIVLTSVILIKLLVLFLVVHDVLDLLVNVISILNQMFLQGHALSNNVAFLSLLASSDLFLDLLIVLNTLGLRLDQVSTGTHGIHKVVLEQVVKRVQIEALVEQLKVDIFRQAHKTDGLVLDLGD